VHHNQHVLTAMLVADRAQCAHDPLPEVAVCLACRPAKAKAYLRPRHNRSLPTTAEL
jgi:hypothetical protein